MRLLVRLLRRVAPRLLCLAVFFVLDQVRACALQSSAGLLCAQLLSCGVTRVQPPLGVRCALFSEDYAAGSGAVPAMLQPTPAPYDVVALSRRRGLQPEERGNAKSVSGAQKAWNDYADDASW